MKYLSFFYQSTFVVLLFLIFSTTNLIGQQNRFNIEENKEFSEAIASETKTRGKLLSPHKLILMVDVNVPKGWELKVVTGYKSMWETKKDTVDLTLRFQTSPDYHIMERLKSVRKPVDGYYYSNVTFAQSLRINHKKLPFFIDAAMELFFVQENGSAFYRVIVPCLLEICKDRTGERTIRVGWEEEKRKKIYLTDFLN